MKETPITFSAGMVEAVLDARKTMIRRTYGLEKINKSPDEWEVDAHDGATWVFRNKISGVRAFIKCPYGQVGDQLWVRETFCKECYGKDGNKDVCYREDCQRYAFNLSCGERWRPSIFMPRWASRITLEITGLRPERLQEITEEDAEAEGVGWSPVGSGENPEIVSAVENFAHLWDSLNAKRGYDWEKNPWVWAITFNAMGVRLK